MIRLYFLFAFGLTYQFLRAQKNPCDESPDRCNIGNIEAARNEQRRLINFLNLPQELKMESRCRAAAEDALKELAESRHWSFYEEDEDRDAPTAVDCNDPRSAMSTTDPNYNPGLKCGVKYPFRPPHGYSIRFMVVVNKDSLQMFRNWGNDSLSKESEALTEEGVNIQHRVADNPKLKALQDSFQFYLQKINELSSQYGTQYFKDLNANNLKGIEFYDEKRSFLQKKEDFFYNNYEVELKQFTSAYDHHAKSSLYEIALKDSRYIEGSTLVVTFNFNHGTNFTSHSRYIDGAPYQASMYHSATTAKYSFLSLANKFPTQPEVGTYSFEDPSCFGTVLFGQWIERGKNPPHYVAGYYLRAQDKDIISVKKTPCDVVQTMELVVQGRKDYVTKFINEFDFRKFSDIMHE